VCVCARASMLFLHTHTCTRMHTQHMLKVFTKCLSVHAEGNECFGFFTSPLLHPCTSQVYTRHVYTKWQQEENHKKAVLDTVSQCSISAFLWVAYIHHTQKFVIVARCIRKRHSCARAHSKNSDTNTAYKPSTAKHHRRFCSCQDVQ
jgi:hypothetical protein